jgi:hypothetical protein
MHFLARDGKEEKPSYKQRIFDDYPSIASSQLAFYQATFKI